MNWLEQLLFDSNSIAHIVLLYTAVISLGVYLGKKLNFFGISLGVTFVLFAGILAGHFGFTGPVSTLNFLAGFRFDTVCVLYRLAGGAGVLRVL